MAIKPSFQFVRIEPYRCSVAPDLLLEANRAPSHISHISKPLPPRWLVGSPHAVQQAVDTFMAEDTQVRAKNGKVHHRKQRSDSRGLLGGITSYPRPTADFRNCSKREEELLRSWMVDSDAFFTTEFGAAYVAAVLHADETCPHIHHYVVGSVVQLHPGLRAEIENGRRIEDDKERLRRYRQAMREFLDRYHAQVGIKYGHQRFGNIRPLPRIPDRKTYLVQKEAQRLFEEMGATAEYAEQIARHIYSNRTPKP